MAVEILPGGAIFEAKLVGMRKRVTNWRKPLLVIDRMMLLYEKDRFAREGPGWIPLADSTVQRKKSMPYQQILQRGEPGHTDGLKQSLTSNTHKNSLFVITRYSLTIGTNVPYAHYHQDGEGVPQRRPFPGADELLPLYLTWRAILEAYLLDGEVAATAIGAAATR